MEEKFIESVKKYPCLWNITLSTYKCNETKDAAWELVVKETNIKDISTAKTKWKKLRDNYREALKRQNSARSGQASKQIRPWKYQHIMEFLLPHMANRSRVSNFTVQSEDHDDTRISEYSDTQNDSSKLEEELAELENFAAGSINDSNYTQSETLHSSTQDLSSDTSQPSSSKSNKRKVDFSDFLQLQKENHEKMIKERAEIKEMLRAPDSTDEVDHFFLAMAKSLKKLPAYLQRQVKRKAMNALMEAEEINDQNQQIMFPNTFYGYSTADNQTNVLQNITNSQTRESTGFYGYSTTDNQTNILQNNMESQNKEPTPPGVEKEKTPQNNMESQNKETTPPGVEKEKTQDDTT